MEHESFEEHGGRGDAQRTLRLDQGRSRGAARRRPRLHDVRAGDDGIGRLADERLADAATEAVFRRHVFSAAARGGAGPDSSRFFSRSRACGATERDKIEQSADVGDRRSCGGSIHATVAAAVPAADVLAAHRRAVSIVVRPASRRLRRRAEISAAERAAVPAARARANGRRRRAANGAGARCARWRSAACATTSAAAFIATRWTPPGACRTSRRCCTTRRSSCWRTSRRRRRRATVLSRGRRGHAALRDARDDRPGGRLLFGGGCRQHPAGTRQRAGAAQDAEGAFYLWRADEVDALLGDDVADRQAAIRHRGRTATRRSIRSRSSRARTCCTSRVSVDDLRTGIRQERRRNHRDAAPRAADACFATRLGRPRPHLDDKVLTAWNGLMIAAFARLARVLRVLGPERARGRTGRISSGRAAAASFLRERMWNPTPRGRCCGDFATATPRSTATRKTTRT